MSLQTGLTVKGLKLTLAALLGDEPACSNNKDNEDNKDVMLITLHIPADMGSPPNTPTSTVSVVNCISSANPSIRKIGSGKSSGMARKGCILAWWRYS